MADFLVHASTKTDAYIYVSGNCEELGMWNPDNAVALNKVLDGDVIIPYHTPRTGYRKIPFLIQNETKMVVLQKCLESIDPHWQLGTSRRAPIQVLHWFDSC